MRKDSISAVDQSVKGPSAPACSYLHISTDPPPASRLKFFPDLGKRFRLEVFHTDVKVKKALPVPRPEPWVVTPRSKIFRFSEKSKSNLLHVCRNSGHLVKSQFCLTYHESWVKDGLAVKAQMNHFVTALKRLSPEEVFYLWVLEFQERFAPHFHFFSNIDASQEWPGVPFLYPVQQEEITRLWVYRVQRLHAPGSLQTEAFHNHKKNFFPWSMKSGSYVVKEYIEKSVQKDVPEDFQNVGRFWGNSRNMIPRSYIVDPDEVQDVYLQGAVEKFVRIISKRHERSKENRVKYAAGLLKRRVQELEIEKGVDSEEVKAAKRHLSGFREKAKRILKLRNRFASYTLPFATGLFFQFMDAYNQVGQMFPKLHNYVPF